MPDFTGVEEELKLAYSQGFSHCCLVHFPENYGREKGFQLSPEHWSCTFIKNGQAYYGRSEISPALAIEAARKLRRLATRDEAIKRRASVDREATRQALLEMELDL